MVKSPIYRQKYRQMIFTALQKIFSAAGGRVYYFATHAYGNLVKLLAPHYSLSIRKMFTLFAFFQKDIILLSVVRLRQ
jgi:hypothetical protein